jgi:hypothetical protein
VLSKLPNAVWIELSDAERRAIRLEPCSSSGFESAPNVTQLKSWETSAGLQLTKSPQNLPLLESDELKNLAK